MLNRTWKITLGILLGLFLLVMLVLILFDWNWLRGPIGRKVSEDTGREFVIKGPLAVSLGWPNARIHARDVTFANPAWAREPTMVSVADADILLDLSQLLRRRLFVPEARLTRPLVYLEQHPDGRKNWLLDREQRDEQARLPIGRLALDAGRLIYDHSADKTHVELDLSTGTGGADNTLPVVFKARGQFRGQPLVLAGGGGPVLALRDESTPYALRMSGNVGATTLSADGRVTSLTRLTAIDMRVKLAGRNLADFYPLFGAALPQTAPYKTSGHLIHQGKIWRYEKFTGTIGKSDLSGRVAVTLGGKRPALEADLTSRALHLADLGPVIGSKKGGSSAPAAPRASGRVLPELPFSSTKWDTIDADVKLKAKSLIQEAHLPLEDLSAHLRLKDLVLTIDPLDFGVAGGTLSAAIKLDGMKDPIHSQARGRVRQLQLARLFPTIKLSKASIGQLNGDFELSGNGDSVARMLGSAQGKLALVVAGGEVSRLMMEMIGLHIPEIIMLKLTGDQTIRLRCGIADFAAKDGVLHTNALVLDTQVTRIDGSGTIDLKQEKLDLTLLPNTKDTSLASLRSPIYLRGSFANPSVQLDKVAIATRTLGAIALGVINPLLALLPLIETGPGADSDCAKLVRETQAKVKR